MTTTSTLLSEEEKNLCKKISKLKSVEGKRAKVLLFLNDGDTQLNAAKKAGLTYGQVKYLLTVFRKKGISIFQDIENVEEKPAKQKKSKPKVKKKKNKKKDKTEKKEKKEKSQKKDKTKNKSKKKKKSKKSKKKK